MANSTLTCFQRIHWRFRSMKAAPTLRTRPAISSSARVTEEPPPQSRDPHLYQNCLAITAPLDMRSVRRTGGYVLTGNSEVVPGLSGAFDRSMQHHLM